MDDEIRDPELAEEEETEGENDLDLGTDESEDDPFIAPKTDEEDPDAHGFTVEDEGASPAEEM